MEPGWIIVTSLPATAVKITIRPADSVKALRFEAAEIAPIEVGSRDSLKRLLEDNNNFRAKLEAFKLKGASSGELSWKQVTDVLEELRKLGSVVVERMLDSDIARKADIQDLFERAFRPARESCMTPVIQITSPQSDVVLNSIPFEFLPIEHVPRDEPISDYDPLARALDRYLGFSAILARDFEYVETGAVLQLSDGRLPVKLFQNTTLLDVTAEMDLFASKSFDVEGPWPTATAFESPRSGFVEQQVLYPMRRIHGTTSRDPPDQIQHFACHCDTFGTDYSFTLGATKELQHTIFLSNLHDWQGEVAGLRRLATCEMPLVFLNACGGAAIDPRQVGSFVRFFLINRNRGFISPQTLIPDPFARKFAEFFYLSLIGDRVTVGEAIHATRRKLAKILRNPLGILYMHFGRAELRVQ